MAHHTGKNLYIEYRGVTISGDQRSFSSSETVDTAETTAGADVGKSYLPTLEDASGSFELVDDGVEGSAIYQALFNNEGTLTWGPEGTASGKPKYSCAVIITGRDQSTPYDDTVMRTYNWQRNGDWIEHYDNGDTWT